MGFHHVGQVGLDLLTSWSTHLPKCWDYRCQSPRPADYCLYLTGYQIYIYSWDHRSRQCRKEIVIMEITWKDRWQTSKQLRIGENTPGLLSKCWFKSVLSETLTLESDRTGFKFHPHHSLWPWESYLVFLSISFLICKMTVIKKLTQPGMVVTQL